MDVAAGTYSSDAFGYDANGNLTRDLSRDITDMEYNALNLPCRTTFADGSRIDWLYTATGEKLRQTVIAATGDTLSRRDYIGSYLFEDNQFERYQLAEGYITPDDDFHAYIPDYQGNIVGVYNTSPNAITSIDSPLDQHTRYYPYGLPFADSYGPTANRRKYGAKELTPDLGLNAYDFEARTLTPAFPAFAQPDPLASLAPNLTTYRYGFCNPVNFTDPHGLFEMEREALEEARKYNNAPVQQDRNSGQWYICLNEAGDDAYTTGYVLYRYFGPNNPYANTGSNATQSNTSEDNTSQSKNAASQDNNTLQNFVTGISAYGIANGVKQTLIEQAAQSALKGSTNEGLRSTSVVTKAMGNDIGRYFKYVKRTGYAGAGITIGINLYYIFNDNRNGVIDWRVKAKAALDIIMTGVGFVGPIGFGLSATYFLFDTIMGDRIWNIPE